MNRKSGIVAYVVVAVFLVAFVACSSEAEVTPESEAATPTPQPAQPTSTSAPPVIEPTEPVIEPTQPIVEPTEPTTEPTQPAIVPAEPTVEPIPDELTFDYRFELDDEGWTTGFADLPVNWTQDLYELEGEYRQLPIDLVGGGIYLQGHNRSDDLFMYVTKQVSGLVPESEYQIEFTLDLATNVPGGLMGIGGSPGESVFVKGGATTNKPIASDDGTGLLLLNVDKGFQASDGNEMVAIGNITHPDVVGEEFKIKTLDNSFNPLAAITDENGQLWLIAGTDSGFEGLTRIYFTGINFHLTIVE